MKEQGFFIREGYPEIGVITVGIFQKEDDRDKAFEKYFKEKN